MAWKLIRININVETFGWLSSITACRTKVAAVLVLYCRMDDEVEKRSFLKMILTVNIITKSYMHTYIHM